MSRVGSFTIKKIRAYFLENSDLTLKQIALNLKIDESTVQFALSQGVLNIVSSLQESNVYFLFTDFLEKKIITDDKKNVKNTSDFNYYEKIFLQGYGFKF